jgi:hypothetical protein
MYFATPFFPPLSHFIFFLCCGSLWKLNELCITDCNLLDFVYVDPYPLSLKVLDSSSSEALGVSGDFLWVHGKILCIYF